MGFGEEGAWSRRAAWEGEKKACPVSRCLFNPCYFSLHPYNTSTEEGPGGPGALVRGMGCPGSCCNTSPPVTESESGRGGLGFRPHPRVRGDTRIQVKHHLPLPRTPAWKPPPSTTRSRVTAAAAHLEPHGRHPTC